MKLSHDIFEDARGALLAILASEGYKPKPATTFTDAGILFYNTRRRTIRCQPRRVHLSREVASANDAKADRRAMTRLAREFARGEDMNKYLGSRTQERPRYKDMTLNHFGMHHLHLGAKAPYRSSNVLFVYLGHHDVYFVGIRSHERWGDPTLMGTLFNSCN